MTKQKQITEKDRTRNVELSDEELDGVVGGLVVIAVFFKSNNT